MRNDQFRIRNSYGKCIFLLKDSKMSYFSATFQTQGNILKETYTQVGLRGWILSNFVFKV